ncbi:MAG: trypsin-like peptidase domain-containing protein [Acidobacteriota bacterium]
MRSGAASSRLLEGLSDELARLAARVLRATVAISGPTAEGGSSGSGFFIDTLGHILTNQHVVAGMEPPVSVTLQGGITALAGVVGVDAVADLALLKLDRAWKHALPLRASVARAGELCLAAGNPLGRYPQTVTIGVVSGLARTAVAGPGRPHYHLLQTDCGIHEGNSGGPLVDVRGRVVGVTTLLDSESGDIGLAIPVETVRLVVPELMAHGRVVRATLGVSIAKRVQEIDGKLISGLEVVRLTRVRSQALEVGDLLVRVAGVPVPDPPALFAVLGGDRIGRPTAVDVVRRGRRRVVTVKPWRLNA